MALSYSNPYSSSSQAQASSGSFGSPPVQRSTFAALANRSTQGYHLFWSGLPADVTESSLQVRRLKDSMFVLHSYLPGTAFVRENLPKYQQYSMLLRGGWKSSWDGVDSGIKRGRCGEVEDGVLG